MAKAAIYVRVSTAMQLDKDSRIIQKKDLIQYSKEVLSIPDYEVFEDAGFSAGSTDRPDYQKMMRRMRAGEFTHLLVWKIDRVSRNIIDFSDLYEELQNLNITFISLAEQFDTSSIIGQALLKMILIFAELERHNAAERSKSVLLSKAESGEYTGFRIPFGYRRDITTKEYTVEESEANLIRTLFDMFDQGETIYQIAKRLNSLPLKKRMKEKWQIPTLQRMLTNIFYTGVLRYNYRSYTSKKKRIINEDRELVVVENDHPAIISKAQYERCQQRLAERKNAVYQIRKPLFADLLICNADRLPLSWKKENNRKCSSPATYSCPYCSQNSFTDEEVGNFVLNYILNLLRAQESLSPSTSLLSLKRTLLRGKEFKDVTDIVNLEEIKNSLVNGLNSSEGDCQNQKRKLRFEIQLKERELERLTANGADTSDVSSTQAGQLRASIDNSTAALDQLADGTGAQAIPQVDYLRRCYDFYMQHNLYHLLDIDYSDCMKNILFYDLKHFFQDVIAGLYVEGGKIIAIMFCLEQEKGKTHLFS